MTFKKWTGAVRPKIQGSTNLHKHLPDLSFFITLSSICGITGNAAQANYAAGNSFLDSLARHRTQSGQPAVVLDLGVVTSSGYLAEKEKAGDDSIRVRFEGDGFVSIDTSIILRLIEDAIRYPLRKAADDCQVVVSINEKSEAAWRKNGRPLDPRFGTLQLARPRSQHKSALAPGTTRNAKDVLALTLSNAATTLTEAIAAIIDTLVSKLSDIFSIPVSDIDTSLPITSYGVDSLVAVELRKFLNDTLQAKTSVFEILQTVSLKEFGALLATRSEYLTSKTAAVE